MGTANYVEGMCFLNIDKYSLGQKRLVSLTGTWLFGKTAFSVSLGSSIILYLLSSVRFLY